MYTVVLVAGIGHPECKAFTGVNRDVNIAAQMAVLAYNNASENTGEDVLKVSDFESLCALPGMQAPSAWGAVHLHSSWSA